MKLSTNGLAIDLTTTEAEIFSQIPSFEELANNWQGNWSEVADSMEKLFDLLTDRNGIPEIRMNIFCEPEYAEKGSKSIMETFESNGTKGRKIIKHPHFTQYLNYFVNGPSLPRKVVADFSDLVGSDASSEKLRHFIRQNIKQAGLTHYDIPSEVFRLAIEKGLSTSTASILRKEAMTAIRKK